MAIENSNKLFTCLVKSSGKLAQKSEKEFYIRSTQGSEKLYTISTLFRSITHGKRAEVCRKNRW